MKLFGKVFLSVITMTVVIFCVSGHLLISMFFSSAVDNKVKTMKQFHVSVYHSLENSIEKLGITKNFQSVFLGEAAGNIRIPEVPETVQFRVYDKTFAPAFQKSGWNVGRTDEELLQQADEAVDAYKIIQNGEKYYLTTASMELLNDEKIYIESVSDVTNIFMQKEEHYQIYMRCMTVLIGLTVILAFVLSLWIVKPVWNQLENNIRELQAAKIRQEEFTNSFAHELKTPLTSIIGYSDMLQSMKMDEEERMQYGSRIFQQGKRLETLSKKMMDLIVLQKMDFQMQKVELKSLFQVIQEELKFVLAEEGIVLQTEDSGIRVKAEPDLLKSVLMNMIDNSRKAIEREGQICLEAVEGEGKKKIIISDNGKGIPKEKIARVTESFYMVDKSRKYEGGSAGLGLAICKKILDLHHASMIIESEVGEGTKITICFEEENNG